MRMIELRTIYLLGEDKQLQLLQMDLFSPVVPAPPPYTEVVCHTVQASTSKAVGKLLKPDTVIYNIL